MMLTAAEVKREMLAMGTVTESDLQFITEEHLRKLDDAILITAERFGALERDAVSAYVWSGNHWVKTTENGRAVWFWEDTPGSQCGRTRTFKYFVNQGDSVSTKPNCPQGYPWYEFTLHY